MKRSPLRRGTARLRRFVRIRPVNPARAAKARLEDYAGPYAYMIKLLPCCTCQAPPPSDPHHSRTRGAGGKAKDLVPLCGPCHRELHDHGVQSFEAAHGVDLCAVAAKLACSGHRILVALVEGSPTEIVQAWRNLADRN